MDDPREKTDLQIEFERLDSTIHQRARMRRDTGTLMVNKIKNRYANQEMIPCELLISIQFCEPICLPICMQDDMGKCPIFSYCSNIIAICVGMC